MTESPWWALAGVGFAFAAMASLASGAEPEPSASIEGPSVESASVESPSEPSPSEPSPSEPRHEDSGPFVVDRAASVLAVVTHKEGVAARLAHEHLVVATEWTGSVDFDPADPSAARARIEVDVAGLVADADDARKARGARLLELGVLEEPFAPLDDGDRAKIAKALLSRSQLDAERYPRVIARLIELREVATPWRAETLPWRAVLEVTIHGETARVEAAASVKEEEAGEWTVEMLARLRFTDFGIEPYSALLGAIRNRDDLDLYVSLVLRR